MSIIGAGEPALPGISIGHNGTIAFGLTIFNVDQEDLYVYDVNPSNAREYRYKDAWEPMRVLRETIDVKGAAPVSTELVFTRHGPVIYDDACQTSRLCRSHLLAGARHGSLLWQRVLHARQQFRRIQARHAALGSAYRESGLCGCEGNIGWVPGGLAPIRPNWDGLLPVPGDGRYEWAGFWPGDKLPSSYNPASGYVTTSNEMNLPADYPYRGAQARLRVDQRLPPRAHR